MRRVTKNIASPDLADRFAAIAPGVPVETRDLPPGTWGVEVAPLVLEKALVGRVFRNCLTGHRARLVSYNSATVLVDPSVDGHGITAYTVAIEAFVFGWEEDS